MNFVAGVIGDAGAGTLEAVSLGTATPFAAPLAIGSTATVLNGISTLTKAVTNLNAEGGKNGGSQKSNVSSGNKNSAHANQKAKAAAADRYNKTKADFEQLSKKQNKTPAEKEQLKKLEKQVKHEKQRMDNTGENHSRKAKGSN
nr:hypothetical protein [uncultured Emticicia sp.]